ncbi:MAG: TnpV protein [Oscillospiraceae bacterium]|nr:TnpV protein [Oscillospiraceae bacterium]
MQEDYYIPSLALGEKGPRLIGRWEWKHLRYSKEYHPFLYAVLLLSGKLSRYMPEVLTKSFRF